MISLPSLLLVTLLGVTPGIGLAGDLNCPKGRMPSGEQTPEVALLVGCESNAGEERLRKYLRMDPRTPLSEAEVWTAALRLMPVGSDEQQVRATITQAGIGSDGLNVG